MKSYGRGIFVVGCGEGEEGVLCTQAVNMSGRGRFGDSCTVPKTKANGGYHVRC